MARPVRQLSLQQAAVTPRHHAVRRQQSEDHSLVLRVTASSLGGSATKQPQAATPGGPRHQLARPRPVKLAWADSRPDMQRGQAVVEVVATRCASSHRKTAAPTAVRAARAANNNSCMDKDTVMYTRQELAERLRKAWKEREKSRPNLNIFLSHITCEDSLNSPATPISRRPAPPPAAQANSPVPDIKNNISVVVRPSSAVCKTPPAPAATPASQLTPTSDAQRVVAAVSSPRRAAEVREDRRIAMEMCMSPRPSTATVKGASYREMSASAKRVTFKNSSSKAVFGSFGSEPPTTTATATPTPPLHRAVSAPSHKRPAAASGRSKHGSEDGEEEEASKSKWKNRPASSRKKMVADKKDNPPPRRGVHRGSDVVTMVSLMSPSGSDSEEASLLDAFFTPSSAPPWFQQRHPALQVPANNEAAGEKIASSASTCSSSIATTSVTTTVLSTAATTDRVPPIRRSAIKSVCFQRQPEQGKKARDVDVAPSTADGAVCPQEATLESKETHREEKLAAATGATGPQALPQDRWPVATTAAPARPSTPVDGKDAVTPAGELEPATEPVFTSPKERECWNLYKRMMDKGVSVSFETVLRGMLTPTEYRLLRSAQFPDANPHLLALCNVDK